MVVVVMVVVVMVLLVLVDDACDGNCPRITEAINKQRQATANFKTCITKKHAKIAISM